jgi:YggT family protein
VLSQALTFLVETVLGLFALALLLRFYLQLFRAPYRNPLSRFLCAATDFAVIPARRLVPGLWGMDFATLALAWLAQFLQLFLVLQIKSVGLGPSPVILALGLALLAAVQLFKMSVYILMVAVLIQAVLSWINPHTPAAPVLDALTRPFLRPIQKRLPLLGGVDLSPLVVIIACQLVLMLPVAWLEANALRAL